jgi:hypothetical protein
MPLQTPAVRLLICCSTDWVASPSTCRWWFLEIGRTVYDRNNINSIHYKKYNFWNQLFSLKVAPKNYISCSDWQRTNRDTTR